jgi:DNA-directed RNA polymerase omega subunit|tara:strand:- start:1573 stop:1842 length:270 start_codon:yes stop_codon:yes gene_type:complete
VARVFANEALAVCVEQGVNGRYEMILLAAERARQTRSGKETIIPWERGQSHVVNALRDFETGEVDFDELRSAVVNSFQKVQKPSIVEED